MPLCRSSRGVAAGALPSFTGLDKSAGRAAVAVGLVRLIKRLCVFNAKYRFNQASQPVFLDVATGSYRNSNPLLGGSVG